MDENTRRAFEWASNQNYQSVAATYARTLAEYVKSVGGIEVDYPNWQGRFPTITDAVKWHTSAQDSVIANLRNNLKARLHVIECIANMQITESTDIREALDLCMSMARLEIEKCGIECSAAGK
jgi:hypothetical protein